MRAWAARLTRKRSPSLPDHVSAATPDSRVLPSVLLTPAAPLSSSTSRRTASTVAASPAAPSSSSSTLFSPSLAAPPTSATRKRRALFRAAARWTWIAFLALVLLGLHELVTGDARDDDARAGTERASARRASTLRHRPAGLTQRRDLWLVDESSTSPSAGDVTAVLVVQPHQREEGGTLSKATLRVLSERVRHLCAHAFFRHVVVWSNAGALGAQVRPYQHSVSARWCSQARCPPHAQDLAGCAPGKLRVHNSPHDLGALARYLACSHASTPLCYFSADVHASAHSRARADPAPTPLRALYAQFIRDPEGPILLHVADESGMRAHWDDCFFRRPFLHTCAGAAAIATSQGGGVFTSQARVDDFLLTATELGFSRHETAKADDAFAIFQNEPPLVITNAGGAGETRDNDDDDQGGIFVELALSRLAALIDPDGAVLADDGASLDADDTAYAVAQDAFRESRAPPLAPHPWAQHARAACSDDTCLLLSNVNLLPPPDLVPWPGPHVRLQDWHERLGRLHGDAKRWASEWPYHAAVDGRFDTALRSPERESLARRAAHRKKLTLPDSHQARRVRRAGPAVGARPEMDATRRLASRARAHVRARDARDRRLARRLQMVRGSRGCLADVERAPV